MKTKGVLISIATLGPVGYMRGGGTLAALLTLPLVYVCYHTIGWATSSVVMFLIFIMAVITISRALNFFVRDHDPSEIVMDEVVGCLVTFYGIPLTVPTMLIGFLLFRFFDIVKPLGIKKSEQLVGVWGVMVDDILAGVLSNLLLYVVYYYLLV
jgi:phosphatidylglycerophosphatase A